MTPTTLQSALEDLYGLERRKDKLGLDGTRALLAALGSPERRFRSVHVAGTNGKGSACAMIERILREAGYRTGLFTSPHLVDFRERIRVDGRWADEGWLFEKLRFIQSLPEGKDRTFFEVVTALGFLYFAERGVEWAVVEVGLGGRLDTTNVITPEVSVITSIGLDHTEILGPTIERIAEEKAGIIKSGVPVVIGRLQAEAERVILRIALERGCPVHTVEARPDDPMFPAIRDLQFSSSTLLAGFFVARIVAEVLNSRGVPIDDEAILRGAERARWPGRLEQSPVEPRLHWDGAHNAEAAEFLVGHAIDLEPFSCVVLAVSRDKDVAGILRALIPGDGPFGRRLIATCSRSERAREPREIVAIARELGWNATSRRPVVTACRQALALGGNVLLTGSLFAVGEAMKAFGGAPGEQL